MEQILFNILKKNPHTWVRYFVIEKYEVGVMPGEYVEIRSNYLTTEVFEMLFSKNFKIDKATGTANESCEILFKRKPTK
jgi:hypothetical protein